MVSPDMTDYSISEFAAKP